MSSKEGEKVVPLQLTVTAGAPYLDSTLKIQPCNIGVVYGQPGGLPIDISVGSGGKIREADGDSSYSTKLNKEGYATFHITSTEWPTKRWSEDLAVHASAQQIGDPDNNTDNTLGENHSAIFLEYSKGDGNILGYAQASGAPADGKTECTIYVMVRRYPDGPNGIDIDQIRIDLDDTDIEGNPCEATVQGTDQKWALVDLHDDGTAALTIYDKKVQTVTGRLTLPKSPDGEHVGISVTFVPFPKEPNPPTKIQVSDDPDYGGCEKQESSNDNEWPAPVLPQANENNVIDVSKIINDDSIYVRVCNLHDKIGFEDEIIAYIGSTAAQPIFVEYSKFFYDSPFGKDEFPDGKYQAWYWHNDTADNWKKSGKRSFTIVNSKAAGYPPPEFPAATDGMLPGGAVCKSGTVVRATYPSIAPNDQVTFHWSGTDYEGNPVPGADWTVGPLTVSGDDAHKHGYKETTIPADRIMLLGDFGMGTGFYEVVPSGGGGGKSLNGSVIINWSDIDWTELIVTKNAPRTDLDAFPHLQPYNYAKVFGCPGADIDASVGKGALIEESGKTAYTTRLDEDGFASFRVLLPVTSSGSDVDVTVYPPPNTSGLSSKETPFEDYLDGEDYGFSLYGYTTGAPGDGETPCSVYAQVAPDRDVQNFQATVDGCALVNGVSNSLPIYFHSDRTCTFHIFNKQAGEVNVQMQLPDGSPPLNFSVKFEEFPSWKVSGGE